MQMKRGSFVRISCLGWADVLVAYALLVMQNYLTEVWKLSVTNAATILNFWNGIYRILPVFFLYLVESFLGNFKLLVITSIAYTTGITLVAMSTPPFLANSTHTCKDYKPECIGPTQKRLLYAGLAFIAIGVAGNRVSMDPFFQSQIEAYDSSHRSPYSTETPSEQPHKRLGYLGVMVVALAGAIALPLIKPWTLRFWIPAGITALGTFLFLTGSCSYEPEHIPRESPISNVCRVFVAAALNMFKSYPDDNQKYNGWPVKEFSKTSCLRGLHKAAIIREGNSKEVENGWRLCSVEEVEEAKIAVRMMPMSMTFILRGVVASTGDTYFIEQAGKLNRSMGKLKLPIQVLLLARFGATTLINVILWKGFKKRESTKTPPPPPSFWNKYNSLPSIGIGMGMICAILCCISAAVVEKMRLTTVRQHGLLDKPDDDVPFSMYWLLFQFVLLGGIDSFMEKSVNLFYKEQSPKSMENYLVNFTQGVSGWGYMSSALSVYVVGKISESGGRKNWFQETLNMSRLDRYYWVLAGLSTVNFLVFALVASRYRYKEPGRRGQDIDGQGRSHMELSPEYTEIVNLMTRLSGAIWEVARAGRKGTARGHPESCLRPC